MIFTKTPLRISLFGGGTDLKEYYQRYEGAVINTTIDKFIYVFVKKNHVNNDIIVRYYDEAEVVSSVDEIKHGIVRESLRLAKIDTSIEIITFSDLPWRGTGLGSSSAFAVGLLNALFAYKGEELFPGELAELASHIEIDLLGEPIGKQDQYAAAFGGLREYVFLKDGGVDVNEIPLDIKGHDNLSNYMILFHTGIERKASLVLGDQKSRMDQNLSHFHDLVEIVRKGKTHLINQEMEMIGELLNNSWKKKRELSEKMQNDVIRKMYCLGMEGGSYGGKLLGAGGGGCFCFICPPKHREQIKMRLKDFKEIPFAITLEGSTITRLNERVLL